MEGSDRRGMGAQRSEVERSDGRWRRAIADGGKRSQVKGRTPFALPTAQFVSSLQSPRSGSGQTSRASPKPMPGFTRLALGFTRLARAADCPGPGSASFFSIGRGLASLTSPGQGPRSAFTALARAAGSPLRPCFTSPHSSSLASPSPWPGFTCRARAPGQGQASLIGAVFLPRAAVSPLWPRVVAFGSVRYHCGSCADPELLSEKKRR